MIVVSIKHEPPRIKTYPTYQKQFLSLFVKIKSIIIIVAVSR